MLKQSRQEKPGAWTRLVFKVGKCSYTESILKAKLTGFVDGLDVGNGRESEDKHESKPSAKQGAAIV